MNILFVITGFDHAGAENQVLELCRELRARQCRVRLVTMIPPTAYLQELGELGVAVHSLGMSKGIPDPRALLRLARLIRVERPDVVHSHLVHANLLARVTRLFVRIPVLICTAHNIREGGQVWEWLYRLTDPLCDVLTNVSREAVHSYTERRIAPARKIRLMENGIDLGRFSGVEPGEREALRAELGVPDVAGGDTFVWLAVGRLVPAKDYPLMLRAFAAARSQGFPASQLWIAGIGPERERVEQEVAALGLADSVVFLGIRQDIPRLMTSADGYVMSSRWEGLPIVLLEACAARLPIVATAVGGNAEVVLDGKNGYVVPPMEEALLAAAMERLMTEPVEKRRELGQCGREHVEAHYAMSRVAERWVALYEQLSGCKMAAEKATYYNGKEVSEG